MGRVIPNPIGDAHILTFIQRLDIIDGAPIPVICEMRVWQRDRHYIRSERRDTVAARKARAWPGDPVRPSSTPFGAESLRGSIGIRDQQVIHSVDMVKGGVDRPDQLTEL